MTTGGVARRVPRGRRGGAAGAASAARRSAPRVALVTGPWVPGAVARLVPAVLVAVVGATAGVGTIGWVALVALAVALVVRPALPAAAVVLLVAGLALLGAPDAAAPPAAGPAPGTGPAAGAAGGWPAGPVRLGVLAVAVDLVVRTSALAGHTGWRSRVEWSVLARLGRSAARAQVVVQGALWLVVGVRAVAAGGAVPETVRLAALLAVGALLLLAVPRAGRPGARD